MSSSQKASADEPEFGNPYELLGLEPSATESEINTAFRKRSLKLHPDKQQGKGEREKEAIAKRFHNLHEARAFLLDPKLRQPYDAKNATRMRRQAHDAAREQSMTERRRKMREELAKREEATTAAAAFATKRCAESWTATRQEEDRMNALRQDGKRRRQEYANRAAEEEYEKSRKKEKNKKQGKKLRQIRLKWSRKRISISPSEHSIADLLTCKFGKVEEVEMIGSKGNAALVTFESSSSCQSCVDFYAKSDEMRATMVVERDDKEPADDEPPPPTAESHGGETLEDRRLRQAAERERLIREMEQEESGVSPVAAPAPEIKTKSTASKPFPLKFPMSDDVKSLSTPFEKLKFYEQHIFGALLPEGERFDQVLAQLKV